MVDPFANPPKTEQDANTVNPVPEMSRGAPHRVRWSFLPRPSRRRVSPDDGMTVISTNRRVVMG
jgi:hypothetical protein